MEKTKETKKNKGITLIALVITIIVLLILAGVSIATLTGDNGILKQANQAKENNNSAAAKEKIQVEALGSINKSGEFDEGTFKENVTKNIEGSSINEDEKSITVTVDGYDVTVNKKSGEVTGVAKSNRENPSASVKPGTIVSKTEKDNYKDSENSTATVPQGFTVSGIKEEQIISNGLVIYDIPESEISNIDWNTAATKYNQFVWIPVTSENEYQREFSYPSNYYVDNVWTISEITPENSTFTDTGYLPLDIQPSTDDAKNNEIAERTAVLKYNGFYIARYEAGNENSNVVTKQNVTVYTNKNQMDFKIMGKSMYGENNNYVKSAMCSGIQWDMVMKFVDGKSDGNGEIYDVRTKGSSRHTGEKAGTGENLADKVQNIYDLESNCWEYVAEQNNTSNSFVCRGGGYYGTSANSVDKVSLRTSITSSDSNEGTFRLVLYIK